MTDIEHHRRSHDPVPIDGALIRLRKFLETQHPQHQRVLFRFGALEEILHCTLPDDMKLSARQWTEDRSVGRGRSWMSSGWRVDHFIPGSAIGFTRTRMSHSNA